MSSIAREVGVAVANYNNGAFLADFFDSLLASNHRPGQLVICDDGSTDDSPEIISSYVEHHDWMQAIFFEENRGVAHANNAAIEALEIELVLRIDSDDRLMPDRIRQQWETMMAHPEIDVLGGNCRYFENGTDEQLHNSNFPATHDEIEALFHQGENGVLNGTTMYRRALHEQYQYRQEMVWAEDYDLFARMLHGGCRFEGQSEAHTEVRIHRASVTSNLDRDTLEKANALCQDLFGKGKSPAEMEKYYKYLLHYRKYMMDERKLGRYGHLLKAIAHRPDKLLKRFRK